MSRQKFGAGRGISLFMLDFGSFMKAKVSILKARTLLLIWGCLYTTCPLNLSGVSLTQL
jgi:hypothetical protein